MAVADILVCIDPTIAGEGWMKLAVGVARAHRAYLSASYIMPRTRRGRWVELAKHPDQPEPGPLRRPEVLTASGTPLDPPISREAEPAEQVEQLFRSEPRLHGVEVEWHLLSPGEAAALIDPAKSLREASAASCSIT